MKQFHVFGELVEVLVSSAETGGASSTLMQTSPPGGGPPPHSHSQEDETFFVVQGEYQFLRDGGWVDLKQGEAIQAMRGSVHTFRNSGATEGKLLIVVVPGGFDKYLEEISPLSMPADVTQLLAISKHYGVTFPELEGGV